MSVTPWAKYTCRTVALLIYPWLVLSFYFVAALQPTFYAWGFLPIFLGIAWVHLREIKAYGLVSPWAITLSFLTLTTITLPITDTVVHFFLWDILDKIAYSNFLPDVSLLALVALTAYIGSAVLQWILAKLDAKFINIKP